MLSHLFDKKAKRTYASGINAPLNEDGETPLHLAVARKDIHDVKRFLKLGADPNVQDTGGRTPLYSALEQKNKELIDLLTAHGATFRVMDEKNMTPLFIAIGTGADEPFLRYLESRGADLALATPHEKLNALHVAAYNGREDLISFLEHTGLDLNTQDKKKLTPLHYAVARKHYSTVETLLKKGANPVLRDNLIRTPLYVAAENNDTEMTKLLLGQDDVRQTVNDFMCYNTGWTPLIAAINNNNLDIVRALMGVGADPNLRDTHGRHSLFHAIEKGLPEMAAFLIKYGADVRKAHACGDNGGKLVHYVPDEKYASLMRLLHREGADINVQDESGDTPLHLACAEGNEAKIRTLLALSADPNIVNEFGRRPLDTLLDYAHTRDDFLLVRLLLDAGADSGTSPSTLMRQSPLHIAARYNRKETMLALLQRNVTVDDTDSEGVTPYMTAIESGHLDIARMLELRGADPSRKDVRHQTLFHLAAENGDKDVMAYVLQLRPSTDINARNAKGETALHLACKKDRGAAAQILLENGADPFLFDAEGHTPLHRATLGGNTRLINLIEEKAGKPIDWNLMTAETKESPLHLAIKGRAPNMLSLLLSKGANPLVRNRNGVTALHYAIVLDHTNMAAELLDCMIERQEHPDTLRDRNGWTFLHYAATRNTHDLSARLIAAGAQIDSRNTAGETPLHLAVRAGQMQNVKYLVEERLASLDIRDDNGNTPLDAALKIGREDVAQFLIRAATARHATPLPAQQNKRAGHRI